MRRTSYFSVFFVLLLGVAVLGYMRGWFVVSRHSDGSSNKVDIELTVDPDKAKADANQAAAQIADTVREGANRLSNKARDTTTSVETKDEQK